MPLFGPSLYDQDVEKASGLHVRGRSVGGEKEAGQVSVARSKANWRSPWSRALG